MPTILPFFRSMRGLRWCPVLALNLRPLFVAIKWPIENCWRFNDHILHAIPVPIFLVLSFLIAYRLASLGIAIFTAISFVVIASAWGLG